jgi:hypothetical protein
MSAGLTVSYDNEADIMEIRSETGLESYGREIRDGFFVIYRIDNNEPIGFTILDFSKTFKGGPLHLPLKCKLGEKEIIELEHECAQLG